MRVCNHKYNARRTEVEGIKFPSRRQANRYSELKLLENSGHIRQLEYEVNIPLSVNGQHICAYRCDFVYIKTQKHPDGPGKVWEDVKGYRTLEYIIKKNLVRAIYGIDIFET